MNMSLKDAINILQVEKGVAELDLSNGEGNQHTEDFVNALDVVFNFIADIMAINKIGKEQDHEN